MVQINKTNSTQFIEIYPLLKQFNNARLSENIWHRIFKQSSEIAPYVGLHLIVDNRIVGFIGLIWSSRDIEKRSLTFCNLTSWIIEEEYRNYSVPMLFEILKVDADVITNLTPSIEALSIFKKFGYLELETSQVLIPYQFTNLFKSSTVVMIDEINLCSDELTRIWDYHKPLGLRLAFLKNIDLYVIFSKVIRKNLPLTYIFYSSNWEILNSKFCFVSNELCKKNKTIGCLIDKRFYNSSCKFSMDIKLAYPTLYKTKVPLKESSIDYLFTEIFLLEHFKY